jgi:hypothetical protein
MTWREPNRDWRLKAELRPSEVAWVSSRSLRTIRRKIASGELPSRFVDGCRLVPIRAVLELVGELPHATREEDGCGDHPPARQKADEILARFRGRRG